MKAKIQIEIEFEDWAETPKTNEEWAEFFNNYLITQSHVIGVEDNMVLIKSYSLDYESFNNHDKQMKI